VVRIKIHCPTSKDRAKSHLLQTRRHPQRPDPHLAVEARAAHPPLLLVAAAAAAPPGPLLRRGRGRGRRRDRPDRGAVPVDHGDARVPPAVRGAPPGAHGLVRGPADDEPAGRARDGEHGPAVSPQRPDRDHVARAVLPLPHHDGPVVAARVQRLAPGPDGQGVHRRRVPGQGGDQVVGGLVLPAARAAGLVGRGAGRPHADALVGGPRVHRAVGRHGDGVHGVVVRRQRLQAAERREGPDLEGLVPGDGEEEAAVGRRRDAGHGVGVLYPEPAVVAADGHVVGRDGEPAEAIGDSGERGGEAEPRGRARGDPPQPQPPVLVARHGRRAAVEVRRALHGARGSGSVGRGGGGGGLERGQVVERHGRRPRYDEPMEGVPRRDDGGRRPRAHGAERGDVGEGRREGGGRRGRERRERREGRRRGLLRHGRRRRGGRRGDGRRGGGHRRGQLAAAAVAALAAPLPVAVAGAGGHAEPREKLHSERDALPLCGLYSGSLAGTAGGDLEWNGGSA
jgi:hypothetical protein